MAEILKDVSRTFNEFLLLPNLTDEQLKVLLRQIAGQKREIKITRK